MDIRDSDKHIKLWDKEKNGDMPARGLMNMTKKYWWKCECGTSWETTIKSISTKKTDVCRKCAHPPKDLIGKKFGKWEVIRREKNKRGKGTWLCRCECGAEKQIRGHQLERGATSQCLSCFIKEKQDGIPVSREFWSNIKDGAKARKIDFDLEIADAYELFLKQDKRCALCGDELYLYPSTTEYIQSGSKIENGASLDRIDSNKGYTIDNVQWVRKDINMSKQSFSQERFIELCNKVANYQNR